LRVKSVLAKTTYAKNGARPRNLAKTKCASTRYLRAASFDDFSNINLCLRVITIHRREIKISVGTNYTESLLREGYLHFGCADTSHAKREFMSFIASIRPELRITFIEIHERRTLI